MPGQPMTRPTAAFLAANLVPDAIGMMPEKPSLHSLPPALAASAPSGAPAVRSRRASLLHNANLRGDLSVATRCGATARTTGSPWCAPATRNRLLVAARRLLAYPSPAIKARLAPGPYAAFAMPRTDALNRAPDAKPGPGAVFEPHEIA